MEDFTTNTRKRLAEDELAGIPEGRKVGRAAVNAVRALFEEHDHIVQEIDGQNDFGEDLYVTFSEDGQTTGDVVKIQVKGGTSWKRANGYAVPVRQHSDTWAEGNIPALCVVYDPDTYGLYWANATAQLRRARREGEERATIGISANARLDASTLDAFVTEVLDYVGRFRGMRAIHTRLGEMAGVEFAPSDVVMHFVNEHDEVLVFWRRLGEHGATLLHSDLDWEPQYVTPGSLTLVGGRVPAFGDLILDPSEIMWLLACFQATEAASLLAASEKKGEGDIEEEGEHGDIGAEVLDGLVFERILERIEAEPGLVERSVKVLRDQTLSAELMRDLEVLESDPEVVREVMDVARSNVDEMSDEGRRLLVIYLVDRILVGGPAEDHVRIVWTIPEPGKQ
ncbi:MAG: DUF4365 domain-containing protein [Nocardiopsis sp. BM-2018]|nr:MAG: DUF4365 domain-containing protein [Nocardiopsis sp. BM-2018]